MTTRSFLFGTTMGAGCALSRFAMQRAFGDSPDAEIPFLIVAAAAIVLGWRAHDPARPGHSLAVRLSAKTALLSLGAWIALGTGIAGPVGRILAWAGGGPGAGSLGLGFARALLATPLLGPPAFLLGMVARSALRSIPAGIEGQRSASAAVAGLFAGILCVSIAQQIPWGAHIAAALFLLALGAFAVFAKRIAVLARSGDEDDGPIPEVAERGAPSPAIGAAVLRLVQGKPVLIAFAAGIALCAWSFAAPRFFSFARGNDLGGFPLSTLLLLGGCALGSLSAIFLPAEWIRGRADRVAAAALCASALLVLVSWTRFDGLPHRFAEWTATNASFVQLVTNSIRLIGPRVLFAAGLLGFACAALARDLPSNRNLRGRWLLQVGLVLLAGFLAGRWIVALQLPREHLEGAMRAAALSAGGIAAAGFALSRLTIASALGAAATAFVLVIAAKAVPGPDREALLVERNLVRQDSPAAHAQRSWVIFDEDGWDSSHAVLRRGHARRLLVNGRNQVSNESVKSHGLLAHLPLLLHPHPRTVIVLGSGNGLALHAALSHPVDEVACFETGRVPVRATARFGIESQNALRDPRLAIRLGDFEDLLARSSRTDVILSQPSGTWTERSAKTTTREFLELAKSRLNDGGFYCQWIPESVLTKEGLKTLFATFARVFPHVQAWSSQGGDVLLLASAERQSLNAEALSNRFAACNCAANLQQSWIEDPVTLLSNFLASDATLRKIAGSAPIHERNDPRLGQREAVRRRASVPVNPVPGIAELGDDIFTELGPIQDESFATLLRQGIEARKLEREAIDLEMQQKIYEAIDAFSRALELNPRDGSVRRSMAALRTRMGIRYVGDRSFTAAHQNLRAAVEIDTTYALGFANLGSLLLYTGPPDYAIATVHQATVLEPDNDLAWALLGHIRRKQGSLEEAIPYYERALALNPENVDAAMSYVDTRMELETNPNIAEAVDYLESFRDLEPQNEELIYRIGKYRDALRRGYITEDALPDSTMASP